MPDQFWALTYSEFIEMSRGFRRREAHRADELLYLAWHTELFARMKTLPKLADLLHGDGSEPMRHAPQSTEQMIAMCRVLNAAFGGEETEV